MSAPPPGMEWLDLLQVADRNGIAMTGRQMLMRMARARRDGWTSKQIMYEYQLSPALGVSPFNLERALNLGEILLNQAIAAGTEPAESRVLVPADDAGGGDE